MKSLRRWLVPVSLALGITAAMLATDHPPGKAQTDPQAQLQQALDYIQLADADAAIPLLQQVSQSSPGTHIDAQARLNLAYLYMRSQCDVAKARQTYQSVANDFTNVTPGFMAQVELLDIQLFVDVVPFTAYLAGLNNQVKRAGGPSLDTLMAGTRPTVITPSTSMTTDEQRRVLGWLYLTAAGRMSYRPIAEATPQLLRQSINIQTYVLDTFPDLFGAETVDRIRTDVLDLAGQDGKAFPQDTTPPRIFHLNPTGHTGPRPDLVAWMDDGTIAESQINAQTIQLTLDGVDVTRQAILSVQTSRQMKERDGSIFQKMKLRYRPANLLTSGTHTAQLKVSDLAGNAAQKGWSFIVRSGDHDYQDYSDDESRTDQEPSDREN